jgi:hypothetical protein
MRWWHRDVDATLRHRAGNKEADAYRFGAARKHPEPIAADRTLKAEVTHLMRDVTGRTPDVYKTVRTRRGGGRGTVKRYLAGTGRALRQCVASMPARIVSASAQQHTFTSRDRPWVVVIGGDAHLARRVPERLRDIDCAVYEPPNGTKCRDGVVDLAALELAAQLTARECVSYASVDRRWPPSAINRPTLNAGMSSPHR